MGEAPDAAMRRILDELEANRKSRRTAWATLQRLRKFLEANGARISIPDERTFESEGEAVEAGLKRTIERRDTVMRSLIRLSTGSGMPLWLTKRRATLVALCKIYIGNWSEPKNKLDHLSCWRLKPERYSIGS